MTASEAVRPQRRVGTFTLGIVLVAAGTGMLVSLLCPQMEIGWLLKASPLILVALGVETLLSARGGGRVKYDWLGMILCFLLVGAAMVFYAAAWAYENGEFINVRNCSRCADETSFRMDYEFFNGFDSHTLRLEAGDALVGRIDTRNGWLEVEISDEDGNALLEGAPLNGDQRVEVPKTGDYTILVHGRKTSGKFTFARVPAELPEEALSAETEETA
ncbi:MAG: hypothetical protein HFF93_00730 [Oscillibacter sp.]|uniref:hypothetical protein n=1 Tax=Oscillibacter sp. TaxID=1945593 RepID=UPI00217204DC|nr:hypothetical protein [Oscillibacter sp.]MCI9114424.1 hypothetical protein [Oscillibacter sp.]MCI9299279.1 hypothetical protein [Oscillibacter sp.]MCI9460364.1 hypothetical protein [Oscillibacter sp.]